MHLEQHRASVTQIAERGGGLPVGVSLARGVGGGGFEEQVVVAGEHRQRVERHHRRVCGAGAGVAGAEDGGERGGVVVAELVLDLVELAQHLVERHRAGPLAPGGGGVGLEEARAQGEAVAGVGPDTVKLAGFEQPPGERAPCRESTADVGACLLYTSDAADE